MSIISIINYKGGVGKTTLTANIAAQLALSNKRVLLVDLDPQTNLTLSFISIEIWKSYALKRKTIKDWFEHYIDTDECLPLEPLIIKSTPTNNKVSNLINHGCVDLISSHFDLIDIEMDLTMKLCGNTPRIQNRNYYELFSQLKRGLAEVKAQYDFILIDCPPNFNVITRNAIVASDSYLVPVKADYLSTMGIGQLERHVSDLTKKYNTSVVYDINEDKRINPVLVGIVFMMVDIRSDEPINAQKEYISRVKNSHKKATFDTCVRVNNTTYSSASEGLIPVVLQDLREESKKTLQKELIDVTNELLSKIGG